MSDHPVPRHQRPTQLKTFLFGAPYYPEHWNAADRADDPQRMAEAGVNVVRMAEFAWDRIEPTRGEFDFSLFDETIDRLAERGISTILCTPTATPPRWLTHGNEDWFRVDADGRRMEHGSRQHCCTNHPDFRAESRRITRGMAEHYADNPHVVGWQTDNEFYCHFAACYCPACEAGFREWLRARYRNVSELNRAWGCAFWALTYDEFEQVPLPLPAGCPAHPNPTHELDHYRYLSDSVREFQREQVEILRAARPDWWITHNGLMQLIDYWPFANDLDFLGADIYPAFVVRRPEDACSTATTMERCRARSGGWIVPEQQSGGGGQRTYLHPAPLPGQMRLWAYQSIAHGADGILHFRWRTCRFGAEEYWNGVLDHDNVPRRRYEEFATEGRELARVGERVLGTTLRVEAGVLAEREQEWAWRTLQLSMPAPTNQRDVAYRELWRRHLPCGMVDAADSFEGLKLLVWPSGPLMNEAMAAKLTAFVELGGVLVVTARSATRDRDNQVIAETPPGLLAELCGVAVEESARREGDPYRFLLEEREVPMAGVYERVHPQAAAEAAAWLRPADGAPSAAAGHPAVTVRHLGEGKAVYVGTFLSDENREAIFDFALSLTDVPPLADCDEAVEVTCRTDGKRELLFCLNHYPHPHPVRGLPSGRDLLAEKSCDGELKLEPFGVAIVEVGR